MLQLTTQQFRQFEQLADRAERDRILSSFLAAHPECRLPMAALEDGIDHARRFAFFDEEHVLRFLRLRWRHGVAFDTLPWARPLWSSDPDAGRRLDAAEALYRRSL
jgi:hypothetical protein